MLRSSHFGASHHATDPLWTGADIFAFTASDGMITSAPSTINLIITPISDTNGASLVIEPYGSGLFRLKLTGEQYERYRIEASENLQNWVTLTNFSLTQLPMGFVDHEASNYVQRFYRSEFVKPEAQFPTWTFSKTNGFYLGISGDPGRTFQIVASTNLTHWQTLTNLLLTNSTSCFLDKDAVSFPVRFYRVLYQ